MTLILKGGKYETEKDDYAYYCFDSHGCFTSAWICCGSLLQPLYSLMDNCYEVRNYSYAYRYDSTPLITYKNEVIG